MTLKKRKPQSLFRSFEDYPEYLTGLLKKKKIIKQTLQGNGRIHIDTRLPFLCVYRNVPGKRDEGTEVLIYGTASYIINGSLPDIEFKKLIASIGKVQSEVFHSFLILEIWADEDDEWRDSGLLESIIPAFRLFSNARSNSSISSTLEVLTTVLSKISVHKQEAHSELLLIRDIAPPKLVSLIAPDDLKKINCHLTGLGIRPVYRSITGKLYPQILESLSRQMVYALSRSFLEFTVKHTTHKAQHYYELGRRTFARHVVSADRKLAGLCDNFDFIIQVSPINEAEARAEFMRSGYKKLPVFYYRPVAFDATEFKKILWNIDLEKIDDPAIKNLFSEKREEIDLQISMMVNLDSPEFHYGSLQLYGKADKSLTEFAEKILNTFNVKTDAGKTKKLNAADFYKHVLDEFKYYAFLYPSFIPEVQINKDMYSGLIVSKNKLLIGKEFSVSLNRVQSLIHHEVGTHLLTYFNGLAQPFMQLHAGLSGYEELQEGLAVLSEYLTGGLNVSRLRLLAARVKTAEYMIDGADFVESFHHLVRNYNFSKANAFTIVMRIYRGGGLTKDIIYLRGFLEILNYIEKGGDIEPLFVGKISLSQIAIMEELKMRKILKPVPLLPRYLKDKVSSERLKEISNGFSLISYFKKLKNRSGHENWNNS